MLTLYLNGPIQSGTGGVDTSIVLKEDPKGNLHDAVFWVDPKFSIDLSITGRHRYLERQWRREPEIRFIPLLPGQNLEDTGGISMDSESEIDSGDDSDQSQNQDDDSQSLTNHEIPSSPESMSLQIVQQNDENEREEPPILNYELTSSDDEEMSDRTFNIVRGPFILAEPPTSSDTVMIDSDDESDPIVATIPIRNGTQFYQDLCASFASRDSNESSEPIVLSAEIDIERVRRRDFSDDRSYRGRSYCSSCGNEISPSGASQGPSREYQMDVDVQIHEPQSTQDEDPPQNRELNDRYSANNEREDINMIEDEDDVIVINDGKGNNDEDEAGKEDDVIEINEGTSNNAGSEENKDDVIVIDDGRSGDIGNKQDDIIVIDDDRSKNNSSEPSKEDSVIVIPDARGNHDGDEVNKEDDVVLVDVGNGNTCDNLVDKPDDVIVIDDSRGNHDDTRGDQEDNVIIIDDDDSSVNDPEKSTPQRVNLNYFRTVSVIKRLCDVQPQQQQ